MIGAICAENLGGRACAANPPRTEQAHERLLVLIEADMGYQIDNMEALGVHRTPDNELVLTLVSDDNFSFLQRTILLQFTMLEQ